MQYWLAKSEPDTFSYQDFQKEGTTIWDGVRNYAARNNLKLMEKGDTVLIYHSNIGKAIVGTGFVKRSYFPDPSAESDTTWVAVELEVGKPLKKEVTLAEIKANPDLQDFAIIKNSRLSVMPVSEEHYKIIMEMSKK